MLLHFRIQKKRKQSRGLATKSLLRTYAHFFFNLLFPLNLNPPVLCFIRVIQMSKCNFFINYLSKIVFNRKILSVLFSTDRQPPWFSSGYTDYLSNLAFAFTTDNLILGITTHSSLSYSSTSITVAVTSSSWYCTASATTFLLLDDLLFLT